MNFQQKLLTVLCDGNWHSGEALGAQFQITRAAIWKQLKQLQLAGINIDSERGKGYRLSSQIELLDRDRLLSSLTAEAGSLLGDLELHFSINSTNTAAMASIAKSSAGDDNGHDRCMGQAIFAEQQLAGRGRRGRHWVSPLGRSIYCSLIWRFSGGASALSGLSLATGVCVVKALERCGYEGVKLKWPNDVLWQDRKLAGILLEMSGDASDLCYVVIGVGINLTLSEADHIDIDQSWVDLLEAGGNAPVSKNAVAAALLNELLPMLSTFEQNGFKQSKADWRERDAFIGREITIHSGSEVIFGIQTDIEDDGAVCVQTQNGIRRFNGGEISLRKV